MKYYSKKVIEYFYSKYRGNMQRKPVQIHKRENYENLYLRLSLELGVDINSSFSLWSNQHLLKTINKFLNFNRCIPYTEQEINDISSNMN